MLELVHACRIKITVVEQKEQILVVEAVCITCQMHFRFQLKPDIPLFDELEKGDELKLDIFLRPLNERYIHKFPYTPKEPELQEYSVIISGNFVENDLQLKMKRIGVFGDRIILSASTECTLKDNASWKAQDDPACWKKITSHSFFHNNQLINSFVFGFTK